MGNKQTAVSFLLRELRINDLAKENQLSVVLQLCEEAKAMEQQQIVEAFHEGMQTNFDPNYGIALNYYELTYGK